MDRPGEIRELCELVRPEIGVVLNIGLTHASKLGSIEAIAEEKLSLPRWLGELGTAVLNIDDARVAAVGPLRCRVLTFGRSGDATVRATSVQAHGLAGTDFSVLVDGQELRAHSAVPGEHTLPAALCAISVAVACGMDAGDAVAALGNSGYTGRMVQRPGRNGAILLDDRYNSSPASLEGALRLLSATPGRRIALLGAMAELGDAEAAEHCRAGSVAAECCDILAASGEAARGLVEAARKAGLQSARWFQDREEAASWIQGQLRAGDHVLIKASRSQAFERVIPLLEAER
jgi:UDP-N-acetylmuramoyl-tripeptide--D-alanyl-D-alanine ligase